MDHHKKGAASNLLDKTAGSTAKTSAVRLVLAIEKKSKLIRTIKPAKVNIFKEIPELESIQVGHEIHIRELTKLTDPSMTDKCEMWLTLPEAAWYSSHSEATLKKAVYRGELKVIQRGARSKMIFDVVDLDKWLLAEKGVHKGPVDERQRAKNGRFK
jgi:hypothetical protein